MWPEHRKQGASPGSHHSFRPNGRQKWYWMWRGQRPQVSEALEVTQRLHPNWELLPSKCTIWWRLVTQLSLHLYFTWFRISHLLDLFLNLFSRSFAAVHTHTWYLGLQENFSHARWLAYLFPIVNMNIVNIKGGRWLKQPTHITRLSGQSRVVARLCDGFFYQHSIMCTNVGSKPF
jgi:hypothetical protein